MPVTTDSRRVTRHSVSAVQTSKTKSAESKKARGNLEAASKKEQRVLESARKKAEVAKKVAEPKKAGGRRPRGKNVKAFGRISKEEAAKREEHQKCLDFLRRLAEEEVDKLVSSIDVRAGPKDDVPVSADVPVFPDDPVEDVSSQSQTPPLRLSPEECKECATAPSMKKFENMIYKQLGHRLRKKPRKYISPFKAPGSRHNVPLQKALALRNKIASDEKYSR